MSRRRMSSRLFGWFLLSNFPKDTLTSIKVSLAARHESYSSNQPNRLHRSTLSTCTAISDFGTTPRYTTHRNSVDEFWLHCLPNLRHNLSRLARRTANVIAFEIASLDDHDTRAPPLNIPLLPAPTAIPAAVACFKWTGW